VRSFVRQSIERMGQGGRGRGWQGPVIGILSHENSFGRKLRAGSSTSQELEERGE